MKVIVPLSVIGIVVLQHMGGIPQASVGGPMTIALALLIAVLAVAVQEAWSMRRGVLGWIVNCLVALASLLVLAPLGDVIGAALSDGSRSLAAAGGMRMSFVLAAVMLVAVFGAWLALQLVNRWRH